MSTYKKILSLLIVPAIILCIIFDCSNSIDFNVSAAETQIVHIFGTDVNLRDKPNGNRLCYINHDVAELLSDEGEWLKIKYNNNGTDVVGYIKYNAGWIRKLTYNPDYRDSAFENQISAFPESYKQSLRLLHLLYPNWKFSAYNVGISLSEAVSMQTINRTKYKQVSKSQPVSWRSMGVGSFDWNSYDWIYDAGWTGASREIVEYYMEPRNFLTAYEIYMFMEQKYDPTKQNIDGLNKIIANSFLAKPYKDSQFPNGDGSYVNAIMNAAAISNVNPYIIASKIIQEQGYCVDNYGNVVLTDLISGNYPGYENLYNYFNIKASGSTHHDIVVGGLSHAGRQNPPWNTRAAAIVGGANFLGTDYINEEQSTYYFQDFDMVSYQNGLHQYAQAVHDAYNKGINLSSAYADKFDLPLEFTIPVYNNTTASPSPMPAKSDLHNNYYILSINGLTPTFDKYTYHYSLVVESDIVLDVIVPEGAVLTSTSEFRLGPGNNDVVLSVKSQTGYTNNYYISVNAATNCTLLINSNSTNINTSTSYKLADVNNDGKITISDIGNIRLHLLGKYTLKDNGALAADVNKDGKITISDIGNIRLHLLGKYTIQ